MTQDSERLFCSKILKVLSDKTRFAVVRELMNEPLTVSEINKELRLDQSLLSHHLKILRDAKLIESERFGKSVRYSVSKGVHSKKNELNLGCCRLGFS